MSRDLKPSNPPTTPLFRSQNETGNPGPLLPQVSNSGTNIQHGSRSCSYIFSIDARGKSLEKLLYVLGKKLPNAIKNLKILKTPKTPKTLRTHRKTPKTPEKLSKLYDTPKTLKKLPKLPKLFALVRFFEVIYPSV